MKLSKIVGYLNMLQAGGLEPDCDLAIGQLSSISHTVGNHQLQFANSSDELAADLVQVRASIEKFQSTVAGIKTRLKDEIARQAAEYYQMSTVLFEQEMIFETPDYILNRRLPIDAENRERITGRIKAYGDWRLPGMIIRPGLESFIEDMVPLDPLYVVDHHDELLQPCVSKFTPEYQRRLRLYKINDREVTGILKDLPDNQFGFIFAYNFLNYKPIEVLDRYLREFHVKLRPGGRAVFTYNDCDYPQGVGLAENNFMCYTPGSRIKAILTNIGFELVEHHVGPYDIAWMEIKKSGEITSLRGGQTLAKIIRK